MKRLIFMLIATFTLSVYCAEAAKEAPPVLQTETVTDMCSINQAYFLILQECNFEAYSEGAGNVCFIEQVFHRAVFDCAVFDCDLPYLLSSRLSDTKAIHYGLWRSDNMELSIIAYQNKDSPKPEYAKIYSSISHKEKG